MQRKASLFICRLSVASVVLAATVSQAQTSATFPGNAVETIVLYQE
jgi:hypothetical protein